VGGGVAVPLLPRGGCFLSKKMVLEKSLSDVVRGLRAPRVDEQAFIADVLRGCREEVKSADIAKKHNAIQKLFYLQMFGYDMSWAAFHVVEVMSAKRFIYKRTGYLAAAQSFHAGTDVLIMCTALIRKDMMSPSVYEAGIALNTLAAVATHDLARDLATDLVSMLNSSRPYIRKRTALVMYKVFLKYPDALQPAFPRLREKLNDPDPGVQAAAVSVVCELARKNPKNYISLAPVLYKIMTSSQNNWVLIKIVKLFASMMPAEPRLAKKLVGPITHLMNSTGAMSLLYECILTCTAGLADHMPTIKLCVTKLRSFVEERDQNLKYLGLAALERIMKIQPRLVAEHREIIIGCLDDSDVSLRMRALALLGGLVTKRNVQDVVRRLLDHVQRADTSAYKDTLIEKVISICSDDTYANLGTEFEWYLTVLMELAHSGPDMTRGKLVAAQLQDVIIRVEVVRSFGVKNMLSLLREALIFAESPREDGPSEVLFTAAWCVGEFARDNIANPIPVIEALLQPGLSALPHRILAVYMQAVLKLFAHALAKVAGAVDSGDDGKRAVAEQKMQEVVSLMRERLPVFAQSQHLEVQERACFLLELLNVFDDIVAGKDIAARPEPPAEKLAAEKPAQEDKPDESESKSGGEEDEAESTKPADAGESLISLDDAEPGDDSAAPQDSESGDNAASPDAAETPEAGEPAAAETTKEEAAHEPLILDAATAYRVLATELLALFEEKLNPVAARAQKKVPVPKDLDLDTWINEPPPEEEEEEVDDYAAPFDSGGYDGEQVDNRFADIMDEELDMFGNPINESVEAAREANAAANRARRGGTYYLGDDDNPERQRARQLREESGFSASEEDLPPMQELGSDLGLPPVVSGTYDKRAAYAAAAASSRERQGIRGRGRGGRGGRGRRGRGGAAPPVAASAPPVVLAQDELPEGAELSDEEDARKDGVESDDEDAKALAAIDFKADATMDLPTDHLQHRQTPTRTPEPAREAAPRGRGGRGRGGRGRGGRGRGGRGRRGGAAGARGAAPKAITAAAPAKPVPRYRPLCQDGTVAAIIELRNNPAEPNKLLLSLALKNMSKQHAVTDIRFEVAGLPEGVTFDESGATSEATVESGKTVECPLMFSGFARPTACSISGVLHYSAGGEGKQQDFSASVPVSAFMSPQPLSKPQFMQLLKGQFKDTETGEAVTLPGSAQVNMASVEGAGFDSMCVLLSKALRCELVLLDKSGSFFGRTAQGGYVAIHAKPGADGSVVVSIKSSDADVAEALGAEVLAL
jgi:Adaptin N terminal region